MTEDAHRIVADAIRARVFPAATMEIGKSDGVLWRDALGTFTFDGSSCPDIHTPFDLASLTKAIATTTVVMELVRTGSLRLDERVATFFDDWRGTDREHVTVQDLLEHASGLPARLLDAPPAGHREFAHDICAMPLEYAPRARSIYSDLGFILLGFLVSGRGGASLSDQFDRVLARLKPDTTEDVHDRGFGTDSDPNSVPNPVPNSVPNSGSVRLQPDFLAFDLLPDVQSLAAPTLPMADDARRGRMLVGEVHDNYAAALGGIAGHAGLFGTAPAVGAFARTLLRAARGDDQTPAPFSPALMTAVTARSAVPGSSRALGWDTMLPTSSCGTRMSPAAFGHVGFTGTSLWIDPVRDRYFVLLTNRTCGGGTVDDMRAVRRAFHDGLGDV